MCECDDDIRIVFCKEKTRKARKEHHCYECHGVIPVGIEYLDSRSCSMNYSTQYSTVTGTKICLKCKSDWDEVLMLYYDESSHPVCYIWGTLKEHVEEAFEHGWLNETCHLAQRWLPESEVGESQEWSYQQLELAGQKCIVF